MSNDKQQRRHMRLKHKANVQLIAKPPAKSVKAKTRNMSDSGLFLSCSTDTMLKVGDTVEVQVLDIENALVQKVKVVRVELGIGLAVKFVN